MDVEPAEKTGELALGLRPRARVVAETADWALLGLAVTALAVLGGAYATDRTSFVDAAPIAWILVGLGLSAAVATSLVAGRWAERYIHPRRAVALIFGLIFVAPATLLGIELLVGMCVRVWMRSTRPLRAIAEACSSVIEIGAAIVAFRLLAVPGNPAADRTWAALCVAMVVATLLHLVSQWALDTWAAEDRGHDPVVVSMSGSDVTAIVVGTVLGVVAATSSLSHAGAAVFGVVAAGGLLAGSICEALSARRAAATERIARLQRVVLAEIQGDSVSSVATGALVDMMRAECVILIDPVNRSVDAARRDGSTLHREPSPALERMCEWTILRPGAFVMDAAAEADIQSITGIAEGELQAIFAPLTVPDSADHSGLLIAVRRIDGGDPFEWSDQRTLVQAGQIVGGATSTARRLSNFEHLAQFDELTGLPSRKHIEDCIVAAVEGSRETAEPVMVLLVDLNGFKDVNDTLGHQTGDVILAEIGRRIASFSGRVDAVGRLGGDEFVLLLSGANVQESASSARSVAHDLAAAVAEPIAHGDLVLDISVSIGAARFPDHGDTPSELIRAADVAMYAAKARGETLTVYEGKLDRLRSRRLGLATDLRAALAAEQLEVVFQPKVSFDDGELVGAESLIRWYHPTLRAIPAGEIVDIAEHAGLLRDLTDFVLRRAGAHAAALRERGFDVPIAVNLTERDIADENLPNRIRAVLDEFGLDANGISLEVTETALLTQEVEALGVLPKLADMGVALAIDDFGTGFSSLSHLRRFPVDEIKIDMSFVERMVIRPNDAVIVRSIVELGHSLGKRVVAEGVETTEAWRTLQEFGTDVAQGNHVMRAIDPDSFLAWASFWDTEREHRGPIEPEAIMRLAGNIMVSELPAVESNA